MKSLIRIAIIASVAFVASTAIESKASPIRLGALPTGALGQQFVHKVGLFGNNYWGDCISRPLADVNYRGERSNAPAIVRALALVPMSFLCLMPPI